MFSTILRRLRGSLALRLTLWYAGIFAVSSILAFTLAYALMAAVVQAQTDEDLEEDVEEFIAFMRLGGLARVETEMRVETQGEEAEQVFFRLWTPGASRPVTTDLSAWPGLSDPGEILAAVSATGEPVLETLDRPQREDGARSIYAAIAPGVVLQIGESLEETEEFLESLLHGFLLTLALVLLMGGPIGWFMAQRALRGVREVTRTAGEIAGGALERRVPVRAQGDELDILAQTFNTMIDRIQALIIGMREMTDNLAHDLRSPLGRIRAAAEMTLNRGSHKAEAEAMAVATTEECDRLLDMINTTLDIAEAESGAARLKFTELDLAELVRDAIDLFEPAAEDRQVTIGAELPAQCLIRGDRQRLQRVVANLLDNALKYTPAGGRVTIGLVDDGRQLDLSFKDTGIGISTEETARVFERFYRCDRSRSQHGNGLGLSLALAFARVHGGYISVESISGRGSTFTVVLPRSGWV